jgi:hypothetical protein
MTRGVLTLYMMIAMTAGCGGSRVDAAPTTIELHPIAHDRLCVTHGAIANDEIREPTVRAFAIGAGGDAGELTFKFSGASDADRALASGELRRQVGLKLRAADGCNLIYVMWRLEPKPGLTVQVKYNPGKHTNEECGAQGYLKVKPVEHARVPLLEVGSTHVLRAEIHGDELTAWVDGEIAWRGRLPDEARSLAGPAGLRSDNVRLEAVQLRAPHSEGAGPACKKHDEDDRDA